MVVESRSKSPHLLGRCCMSFTRSVSRQPEPHHTRQDNLLGFLFTQAQSSQIKSQVAELYSRALDVCSFVQRQAVGSVVKFPQEVSSDELPRIQRLYLTSANICLYAQRPDDAIRDYSMGIELMIQPPFHEDAPYTMREFVLASFVAGYLVQVSPSRPFPRPLAECFSDDINFTTSSGMLTGVNILQAVRSSGDGVLRALLHLDGNVLPFLLLLPEQVARIPTVLFSNSMGILPAICKSTGTPSQTYAPSEYTRQQANTTTVNIILALAKYFQEIPSSPSSVSIFGLSGLPNINNALSILFYYLALSISPSPSTFNNMGIVLASAPSAISWTSDTGETDILSGADLAKIFYRSGLQLDPLHPHLLTNLGSSYKDEGNLEAAIQYVCYLAPS